jgi:hypothetical protein
VVDERNGDTNHHRNGKADARHRGADRKIQARLQSVGARCPQRSAGFRRHYDHGNQYSHDSYFAGFESMLALSIGTDALSDGFDCLSTCLAKH